MSMIKGLCPVAVILLLISQATQIGLARNEQLPVAPAAHYRAFDSKGKQVSIAEIAETFGAVDVALVGESHDDPIAHQLEAELLWRANDLHGSAAQARARSVALSLEMFERDAQLVVDEYLAGLISERHFLLSSRPWKNYQDDYRPLVEYAHARKLPVIAANAPARYVSRVSNLGPASLKDLSKVARSWLPPLPYLPASEAYAAKFRSFMSAETAPAVPGVTQAPGGPNPPSQAAPAPHATLHLLDAQNLRDATMAFAISEHLKKKSDALVVHVNGKFHSEERLGVPEHIRHYRPNARTIVVTILRGEGFPKFDAERLGKFGDFVVLTDPAVSR